MTNQVLSALSARKSVRAYSDRPVSREEAVVQENTYRPRTEAELRADFALRSGEADYDFDRQMSAFHARKYDSGFSREMSRSARVYLADFLSPPDETTEGI